MNVAVNWAIKDEKRTNGVVNETDEEPFGLDWFLGYQGWGYMGGELGFLLEFWSGILAKPSALTVKEVGSKHHFLA